MKVKQMELFGKRYRTNTVKLVKLKMVCEESMAYSKVITHRLDVLDLVRTIYKDAYCEIVTVICLNCHNSPTAISVVNQGSVNQSMVSPGNVWKLALTTNAVGIIMCHNHPAGTMSPSNADKEITNRIKEGGKLLEIDLIDHLILNPTCTDCYSFREHSLI